MSELTDRLRAWAYTTGPLGSPRSLHYEAADALDAAEAKLDAIDALLIRYAAGPPELAPLLDDLFIILHPTEDQ